MIGNTNKAIITVEKIIIPTYGVGIPDKNPMFLEKRVYQGSSGKVYPYPVIDRILDKKTDKEYTGVWLENQYIKILVLPELGGRIQRAYDKTNGYDFVYYNEVIKPALVGLLGPWISGGIEFNWPQHHRPTTFSPVDYMTEESEDGSVSMTCSEVDQMYGTKGEMTFTLYPDKAYIEIKGRLYNRTNLPQTFMWWANPAVAVNDNTQSIFPPDVHAVFDHGKRDVSKFPIATGKYYKYDYSKGIDISRYKNIPVPTSYMCYRSDFDFVGGYDYSKEAGLLHVADHHISPGKKQWTWGCGDFGQAWDRNLTDNNGPYVELMTGVYTDNQPDFSWLKPFEEKTFTQYFMPYKKVGNVKNASIEGAINLEKTDSGVKISAYATSKHENCLIELRRGESSIFEKIATVSPEDVVCEEILIDAPETELELCLYDCDGRLMLSYSPEDPKIECLPEPAESAKDPKDIMTVEELYLTALHIEQYRHATYEPDEYYLEALRRDPGDIRINTAYGTLLLRRGLFRESESYFRTAIKRLTWKNPNPYCSEAYMYLGIVLWYQGKIDEAYDMFYKSTWTAEQSETGYYYLAAIASKKGNLQLALEHIDHSLVRNSHNLKARALRAMILYKLNLRGKAERQLEDNLKLDKFDYTSRFLLNFIKDGDLTDVQMLICGRLSSYIESAIDFADGGLYKEAISVLDACEKESPIKYYYKAYYSNCAGISHSIYLEKAAAADPLYCFPNKLEDIIVLEFAKENNKDDGLAHYYLGCEFYDKKRYLEAQKEWEAASTLCPQYPTVWRNLSIVYFNKCKEKEKARKCLETAFRLDRTDARVFQELDQLYKKTGVPITERLKNFEINKKVWELRDEMYVEYVSILNSLERYEEAYNLIMARNFHPWEGGEGKVISQYVMSLVQMAKQALDYCNAAKAKELLKKALVFPHNLGEGKLIIAKDNNIHYYLGLAERMLGDAQEANEEFKLASLGDEELAGKMYYNDQPADLILYQGLALQELGENDKALAIFHKLVDYGEKHYYDNVKIDYFAVSLPELQLFEEDLTEKNRVHCNYLIGLGSLGLQDKERAKKCFDAVLCAEDFHQGAIIHRKML